MPHMESIHLLPHFLLQAFWGPRTPTGRKGHRCPLPSESCQETLTTGSSLRTIQSLCKGAWAALRTGHYREFWVRNKGDWREQPFPHMVLEWPSLAFSASSLTFSLREKANKLHYSLLYLLNKMVVLSRHTITPASILVSTLEIHAAFGKSLKGATKSQKVWVWMYACTKEKDQDGMHQNIGEGSVFQVSSLHFSIYFMLCTMNLDYFHNSKIPHWVSLSFSLHGYQVWDHICLASVIVLLGEWCDNA